MLLFVFSSQKHKERDRHKPKHKKPLELSFLGASTDGDLWEGELEIHDTCLFVLYIIYMNLFCHHYIILQKAL